MIPKKYLEKEKCSEQSIEKYYENKKIEPFEKEVKIDTITKNENCTVDNDKEEINEEFKKLVDIIGYNKKIDNSILQKTEENKKDEKKEGKQEEEKGNNHENKNKPIEKETDKKNKEQKKELNNNENKESEKNCRRRRKNTVS